ncbi:hypothetical protein LTR62_008727 [Meristemomyces frigidus]|uniref:Conserved oligomeric Golgi complex subunit 1 n=1 Tax=Meristemomyces frigidus TaxID=1508187 RepID=A0AAN7T9I0_9PEZI|nr:hypothetical protein LTR62_008727 [Meristemomyces frigidus]
MADLPLDPRTLDSWEDAFQFPLPVVRKLEQQLRRNIDENRQKLRSLVGASYRDLLGTAERIIEMDGQMRTVEANLVGIGKRCNAGRIERIGENQVRMMRERDAKDRGRLKAMGQTKVLQGCLAAAQRTMRSRGDALVVAKLLVLARLLHKSVCDDGNAPDNLDEFRRKLGMLRRKLVVFIDRSISQATTGHEGLAHSLAAYALVTSSSAKDVLRHFLQVNLERIEDHDEKPSQTAVLQSLQLYKQTWHNTHALFPRAFTDAVSRLSKQPLLQDPQIGGLDELSIDLYGNWIADEVRSFIPWLRQESITNSEVQAALKSWSREAQSSILSAVTDCIASETDVRTVLEVRRKVVVEYMAFGSSHDSVPDIVHAIRDVRATMLRRLHEIVDSAVIAGQNGLDGHEIDQEMRNPHSDLWSLASQNLDLRGAAVDFRTKVVDRQHGRDSRVQVICRKLNSWVETIDRLRLGIKELRSTKWASGLDIDLDDLDDGNALVEELNKRDPDELQLRLRDAAGRTLQELHARVQSSAKSRSEPAFYLRVLRELKRRERSVGALLDGPFSGGHGQEEIVATLQHDFAVEVSGPALKQWSTSGLQASIVPTTLWEGSPALPIQPCPAVFRFLTILHKSMAEAGHDLWSPETVRVLKAYLNVELTRSIATLGVSGKAASQINGHKQNDDLSPTEEGQDAEQDVVTSREAHDQQRAQTVQLLFDLTFLARCLDAPGRASSERAVGTSIQEVSHKFDLDQAASDRLTKSANEYWRRTYLLFGLLADSHE